MSSESPPAPSECSPPHKPEYWPIRLAERYRVQFVLARPRREANRRAGGFSRLHGAQHLARPAEGGRERPGLKRGPAGYLDLRNLARPALAFHVRSGCRSLAHLVAGR